MSAKKAPAKKVASKPPAKKAPAKKAATGSGGVAKKAAKKTAKKATKNKPGKVDIRIARAIAAAVLAIRDLDATGKFPAEDRGERALGGGGGRSYPAVLPFLVGYCSACENRRGGEHVGPDEVLSTLRNVRQGALNAVINDTYHIPAGVRRYPATRPSTALTVAAAAVDVRGDLANKGIAVPIS